MPLISKTIYGSPGNKRRLDRGLPVRVCVYQGRAWYREPAYYGSHFGKPLTRPAYRIIVIPKEARLVAQPGIFGEG